MITNTTAKSVYPITQGATYPIGFTYQYNPNSTPQIKVYIKGHPETPLVYGTNYKISDNGLDVVLITEYTVGDTLVILRDIPQVQLSDYVIGRIDPEQIEKDFDEAVMRDQQLQAEVDLLEALPIDHELRIQAIEAVIPDTATSSNQLTDKNYVDTHINRTDNPHSVTKAQVGLGNCDNTSDLDKPVSTATQTALDGKVNKNADITGATHTKITYDSKGLVTGGSDITLSDVTDVTATAAEVNVLDGITASTAELNIMDGVTATTAEINHLSGVTSAVQTQLDGKVDENAAITGATKCKITYDSKGLVTAGDDISTSDLTDVSITTPTTGEVLTYDSTLQKWKNTASSATVGWGGISGTLSDQTDLQNALNAKANDNGVVHLTDNETIAGKKIFVSDNQNYAGAFTQKTSYIPYNYSTNGSTQFMEVKANDDTYLSWFNIERTSQYKTNLTINARARNAADGANNDATLGLTVMAGDAWATAPASDVAGSIVTTAAKNKNTSGYYKLGNGLIVQWKNVYWTGNNMGAITLPTAFTSAQSFKAIAGWANDGYGTFWSESAYPVTIADQTSSSVTLNVYTGLAHNRYINIIAIGY